MRHTGFAIILSGSLFLAACGVDTTGLSAVSTKKASGPDTALVTVTEYGDLQCNACKGAHTLITKPLLAAYDGRIRFEFKHFPIQSIHPYALQAAQASECAADQGKFWEFLNLNYEKQEDLSASALRDWAGQLQLDVPLFDRCVKSGIKKKTILSEAAEGEALGVNSTPTYFVNRTKIPSNANTIEAISAAIDTALNDASALPL